MLAQAENIPLKPFITMFPRELSTTGIDIA
jgi:hypothetical protein